MKKPLRYKKYEGTAEYDDIDDTYFGHVVDTRVTGLSIAEYCASTQQGLTIEFQKTVDTLIELKYLDDKGTQV